MRPNPRNVPLIEGRDDEFRATIRALYLDELGREPDPEGLANWLDAARRGFTGELLRAHIHGSPEAVAYRQRAQAPPVPLLGLSGRDFVTATGARQVLCGCDAFLAYRQYLDGASLDPFFRESRALGFTLWRVFLMGAQRQNQVMDLHPREPSFYARLRAFAQLLNAHGIVLLATVHVDAQDVMPDAGGRRQHWLRVADELRGTTTILSYGNEAGKNGFSPAEAVDPGLLWSRGSGLADQATPPNGAPCAEFHPRRDLSASLLDSVASPIFLYSQGGEHRLIMDEPLGYDETDQPGRRSTDPGLAWRFGRHYATECAGAVFHNSFGQRGLLLGPRTRACAEAWVDGMRI